MWTSGVIAAIEPPRDAASRLADFLDQRREGTHTLRSQVRLDERLEHVKGLGTLLAGTVFDEFLVTQQKLVEDPNGRFRLGEPVTERVARWGRFWLTTKSVVVAQRFDTADFTFRILGKALAISINVAAIDIQRMGSDVRGHWLGAISGRRGHVQSAMLYGDDIEDDSDMGETYIRSQKRQIGFWTDYFGGRTKVKVTHDGSVTVYTDLHANRPAYVAFVRDFVLPYRL